MKPIALEDILDIAAYEKIRPAFRRKVISAKKARRLPVGDRMTLLFENRDTVLFQIQEMMRVERIVHEDAIRHEIATYNELIPAGGEISATMFIEVTDPSMIRDVMDSFVGLPQHCVFLSIGDARIDAVFDLDQSTETRISAVQYIKFPLPEELRTRFMDESVPVRVHVDHPNHRHVVSVEGPLRAALMEDLAS